MTSFHSPYATQVLSEYTKGRRDFQNSAFSGYDFFSAQLELTHKELFENKLSSLVLERAEIIKKPITGIELEKAVLNDSDLTLTSLIFGGLTGAEIRRADLRMANLAGADLRHADLCEADLRYTNLFLADLSGANLRNAKLDGAIASWATFDGANMHKVTAVGTNFTEASLSEVILTHANMRNAVFFRSRLNHANVQNSSFQLANLLKAQANNLAAHSADFIGSYAKNFSSEFSDFSKSSFRDSTLRFSEINNSNFYKADFHACMLSDASLKASNFIGTNLRSAVLSSCKLENSKFKDILMGNTSLSNLDLDPIITGTVKHQSPSFVDHLSVSKTVSHSPIHPLDHNPLPQLRSFLVASGVPTVVAMYSIDASRTLQPDQMVQLMRSTFISYGRPDQKFAERLNTDLLKNGVTTFFFPMNAQFGEKLHSTMRRVDQYDRIILICSKRSLDRNGVQYELEKTIDREARDGGQSYLIPIALDDFIFDDWKPEKQWLRDEILNRVVADFRDRDRYEVQFARLLQALKNADHEISENRLKN